MAKSAPKMKEENEQVSESYISIGLGLLVVVVVGILLYNYFTSRNANKQTQNEEKVTQEATTSAQPGSTYVVQEGDTLWSISEKSYGTGFDWPKIAEANKLSSTDSLEAGQKLEIPVLAASPAASAVAEASATVEASPATTEATPAPTASPTAATPEPKQETPTPKPTTAAAINGTSYTVVEGDTLWDIACRAYGDCYAWTKIATENKLVNPDLIHPGNVFTLPR